VNRFRVVATLVSAGIVGLQGLTAAGAMNPPWVEIPGIVLLVAFVGTAMLVVIKDAMPSWVDAPTVARATEQVVAQRAAARAAAVSPGEAGLIEALDRARAKAPPHG
jgi:hypothetical protein